MYLGLCKLEGRRLARLLFRVKVELVVSMMMMVPGGRLLPGVASATRVVC